ncbi:murein biosynthesis integral membrane protein MurJ [Cellulomonas hominis]|uniref:murein biosynthesis integral membrane protein MurJ n=1 Tax=Cellulomonas hominis TaxID=156981 RepID=UPI001B9E06A7|nr:murein biosynthesis integral membrane protein MurJ [Cellulomonas hominis]VTR75813.1 putative peptidoglycan biosynthesis protein MviN [Cellulomonas hominis]
MTTPATAAGGADPDGTAAGATAGGGTDPAATASAAPRSSGLGRSSLIMASGTAASRVLGVVNTSLLAWAIGLTGSIANAFSVANKLPNTLYLLIAGGVLNAVLVPQVVRAYRRADGQQYVDRLLTVGIVLLAGLTVVLTAAAPLLVRFYSQFPDPRVTAVATALAFWCIPQIFFYGLYSLLGQILNARGSFGPYMWAPVVNNLVFIGGLLVLVGVLGGFDEEMSVTEWTGSQTAMLGAAATLGIVVQALVLFIPLYRSGFRYRPRWGLRGSGLGSAGRVATWTFLGLLIGQVGVWRISVVASSVETADAAGNGVYDRAFLIFMLPHSLVTVSLATALFTRLSGRAAAGDVAGVRQDLSLGLRTVGVFTVLATAGIAVLAFPLGRALFPSNTDAEVHALAMSVFALVLGLVAFGAWSLFQRVYYAYEDARSMVPIQLLMAAVVVGGTELGRATLDDRYWVAAACASMALSYGAGALVALVSVRRRLHGVDGRRVLVLHLKALLGGVLAAGAGIVLLVVLGPVQDWGDAVVACIAGAALMSAVYVGVLAALRVRELQTVAAPLLRRFGRGR